MTADLVIGAVLGFTMYGVWRSAEEVYGLTVAVREWLAARAELKRSGR